MRGAIDEQGLTFTKFVDCVISRCRPMVSLSFVNPQEIYRVLLVSKVNIGKEYVQSFDEHYLQPIAQELGLNLTKTAKLVALRNAWIAYFQESEIPLTLVKGNQLLAMNEIVMDYVVLTSAKWTEHPRLTNCPWVFPEDDDCVSTAEAWDRHQWQQWLNDQEQEGGIWSSISDFRKQKQTKVYTSLLEKNADYAANDIKLAKNKIQELHCAIEEQDEIIRAANRPIRKFQNSETLKKKTPGRPKIAEMQDQKQQRRDVAMEYVKQWVDSLMSYLSITSRAELARMVGGQKMTWGRWLNKETLPSSRDLKSLLDVKIKSGQHQNTKLRDIQTSPSPSLTDLITLVDLV